MTSITPAYYAANQPPTSYTLYGTGFNTIPSNAVGLLANDNNNPLGFRDFTEPNVLFSVNVISDNQMVVYGVLPTEHSSDNYLGGIVSEDRQSVYWENNTQPLP